MKPSKAQERKQTIVFMFLVTVVCITAVSGTYLSLKDMIERNLLLAKQKAILGAAGVEIPEDPDDVVELYASRVNEVAVTNTANKRVETHSFVRSEEGAIDSVVLEQSGAGLWGTITAVIGFDPSSGTLTGVRFTEQNETPGLGARIEETRFQDQFDKSRAKRPPFTMVAEGKPTTESQFDAITGATITSTAVRDILNRAGERVEAIAKETAAGSH